MATITGTKGNIVEFKLRGVREVQDSLMRSGQKVQGILDGSVFRTAVFMEEEIRSSVAGKRPEQKSVDTGRFLNSVRTKKKKEANYEVFSDIPYAGVLEFGSSRIRARSHFRNSAARNQVKVREEIKKDVDRVIKSLGRTN